MKFQHLNMQTEAEIRLNEQVYSTLERIKQNKVKIPEAKKSFDNVKSDMFLSLYEDYSEHKCIDKIKHDQFHFANIFKNISEEIYEAELNTLIQSMKDVYEVINIAPQIFGFKKNSNTYVSLENSDEILKEISESDIQGFMKTKYLRLTPTEVYNKFKKTYVPNVKHLISTEHLKITEAGEKVQKQLIMDELISAICIPKNIIGYVDGLVLNEAYSALFDTDKLMDTMEAYKTNKATLINAILDYI